MQIELIDMKSTAWGIIPLPSSKHYHTGYQHEWNLPNRWDLNKQLGDPFKNMQLGKNAILTGEFRIDNWTRGRSAANFVGHFKNEDISYILSMEGMGALLELIQNEAFPLKDGYFMGRFTFVKQGQNIFIRPHV